MDVKSNPANSSVYTLQAMLTVTTPASLRVSSSSIFSTSDQDRTLASIAIIQIG